MECIRRRPYLGPDQVQVNCRLKVKYRKNLMLVCQMLAKPAQILSYNSLANLQLYDLYMIWLLMCARLMRCWPALLLLFHFFRKSGFWVACQVLFAKILTNFMSALFIRRCWCFGPRPAGQSIFATTAFSQLMMLLSEREDLQRRWTFLPNQFFFLFIFYSKVGHFFLL